MDRDIFNLHQNRIISAEDVVTEIGTSVGPWSTARMRKHKALMGRVSFYR